MAKLYFTGKLKGSLALQMHNCSVFWASKAVFEAGRYVLIICRLNDDTRFIINKPFPSTLPQLQNSPEREWVLALAAFSLFDLGVITPLFGDHTTSFMLSKALVEGFFFSPLKLTKRGSFFPLFSFFLSYSNSSEVKLPEP